jgi:hypothetical protein
MKGGIYLRGALKCCHFRHLLLSYIKHCNGALSELHRHMIEKTAATRSAPLITSSTPALEA